MSAYINLGVPAQNLVTSSVMSIPASIAISKMRLPEKDEPVTRGRITVDRGDDGKSRPVSTVDCYRQHAYKPALQGECSSCVQSGCLIRPRHCRTGYVSALQHPLPTSQTHVRFSANVLTVLSLVAVFVPPFLLFYTPNSLLESMVYSLGLAGASGSIISPWS